MPTAISRRSSLPATTEKLLKVLILKNSLISIRIRRPVAHAAAELPAPQVPAAPVGPAELPAAQAPPPAVPRASALMMASAPQPHPLQEMATLHSGTTVDVTAQDPAILNVKLAAGNEVLLPESLKILIHQARQVPPKEEAPPEREVEVEVNSTTHCKEYMRLSRSMGSGDATKFPPWRPFGMVTRQTGRSFSRPGWRGARTRRAARPS